MRTYRRIKSAIKHSEILIAIFAWIYRSLWMVDLKLGKLEKDTHRVYDHLGEIDTLGSTTEKGLFTGRYSSELGSDYYLRFGFFILGVSEYYDSCFFMLSDRENKIVFWLFTFYHYCRKQYRRGLVNFLNWMSEGRESGIRKILHSLLSHRLLIHYMKLN